MKRKNVGCICNPWPQVRYQFFKHVVMMGIKGGNLSTLSLSPERREEITECYIPLVSHFSLQQWIAGYLKYIGKVPIILW